MRNYQLKISDYRYPNEIPALIITMIAAAVILVIFTLINIAVGLLFVAGILFLFFELYRSQMTMLGSCVKVGPNQFPEVYRLVQTAADRLDMNVPNVYIMQTPVMNAFATGFWGNYFVVLHTATIEALSEEELLATIGHEFTHIKGNHVILSNLAAGGIGSVQLMWWLQMIIKLVFLYMSRCFEYTSDRGGLIACGSIQGVITENVKFSIGKDLFSRINIMEFFNQALELDRKPLGILGELDQTHPLTVKRIRQAVRFYRSEKYQRIAAMQGKMGTSTLQGSLATGDLMAKIVSKTQVSPIQSQNTPSGYNQQIFMNNMQQGVVPPMRTQQSSGFCIKCGTPKKVNSKFCPGCGSPYMDNQPVIPIVSVEEEDIIPVVVDEEQPVVVENINSQMAAAKELNQDNMIKICPKCGEKNRPEATFCTECGGKI